MTKPGVAYEYKYVIIKWNDTVLGGQSIHFLSCYEIDIDSCCMSILCFVDPPFRALTLNIRLDLWKNFLHTSILYIVFSIN